VALRYMRIFRYLDEVARVGSVRQAAERLHVTPSAVLRRIQDVEQDLGVPVFERTVTGVQLTAAGEILIRWIRVQNAELRRVYSQIEELSGLRRGEVRIACSQAVAHNFLPEEIAAFRVQHPLVSFQVKVTDHDSALQLLTRYETDLVLIFNPPPVAELQPVMSIGQRLVAIMAAGHELTGKPRLRLRDCLQFPVALPDGNFGGRQLINEALATSSNRLNLVLEANSFEMLGAFVALCDAITFQIEIGARHWQNDPRLAVRPLEDTSTGHAPLVLGQLKGRSLPLAAAKFSVQLARRLDQVRTLPTAEP